ncbi:MAG: YqaE/Pmp3 family membrane protein [Oligosphaeraceae bacterium]|nr:YqaE/Pmp3 family membrane protein [Oligosphaeraceae bacterium]
MDNILFRFLLCLIFPPLAVIDKGCGVMIVVFILTLMGWLPGTVVALCVCISDRKRT